MTETMKRQGRNIWRLHKGCVLPPELGLVKDTRPDHKGHYMIPPIRDMSLKHYLGLIEELERDPAAARN